MDIEQLGLALNDMFNQYLSSYEKSVVEMFYGLDTDKKSYKEISEILKSNVKSVKQARYIALQKLKTEKVKDYLKEFYDFD